MQTRLWAPWRMQYISEPKAADAGCVLCAYNGQPPARESLVLVQAETCFVVLNKYPYVSGHLLVVCRRHACDMQGLPTAEWSALWQMTREAGVRLCRATGAEGLNIGLNLGAVSGAGIEQHLHVHVVPRWQGDNNFMPVIAGARVLPEYLETTWDRLRPHFQDLDSTTGARP